MGLRTNEAPPSAGERNDPDLSDLLRAAQGDVNAFAALVERHSATLHRLCERLLGNREEARDAVQEVFVKVYRRAPSFRREAAVRTWLSRIAVNHCLNQIRRHRLARWISFEELAEDERTPWQAAGDAPDPEQTAAAREEWREAQQAIARLPANQRAVLVLARFEGLSNPQIAELLETTVGAVESRLVRALRNLQRTLGPSPARGV